MHRYRREGAVIREAESRGMQPQPRNARSHQRLEKARTCSLELSEGV